MGVHENTKEGRAHGFNTPEILICSSWKPQYTPPETQKLVGMFVLKAVYRSSTLGTRYQHTQLPSWLSSLSHPAPFTLVSPRPFQSGGILDQDGTQGSSVWLLWFVSPTKARVLRTDPPDAAGRWWDLWEVESDWWKLGHWRNGLEGTTETPALGPHPLPPSLPSPSPPYPIPLFLAAMMYWLTTGPKAMAQMTMNCKLPMQ